MATNNGQKLENIIEQDLARYGENNLCPHIDKVWNAFIGLELTAIKTVILGQDPYPNSEHATGLAFGVPPWTTKLPPSLLNIHHELDRTIPRMMSMIRDVTLENIRSQGVLLLNSSLTTIHGAIGKHMKEWQPFTQQLLDQVVYMNPGLPIACFGKQAQQTLSSYAKTYASVLNVPHPAAANYGNSFGVVGTNVFVNINMILEDPRYGGKSLIPIDWRGKEDDLPF